MLLELIQADIYVLLDPLQALKPLPSSSGVTSSKLKPHSQTLKRTKLSFKMFSLEMLNFLKSLLMHLLIRAILDRNNAGFVN